MSASFDSFKSSLAGDVLQPGDDGYEQGIKRWSPTGIRQAQYVVYPKTTNDIAAALKFVQENNIDVAICGGGHSWSGASSTTGLTIHLGKYFNGVRCDPDKKLFYVGGGAIWETVDKEGIKYGLGTVAGTYNDTGVGGLSLGGGYGWLSGQHGLVVDNIVEVTIVLASGEVVTANENSHPDLYWAVRGGGGNFGVVTEFVLKAHPQRPTVFVTQLIFPVEKIEAVINAVNTWFETAGPEESLIWAYFRVPPTFQPMVPVTYFYNGDAAEGKKRAKILYDVGAIMEIPSDELPYEQLNTLQKAAFPPGKRVYGKGQTISAVTYEIIKVLMKAIDETVEADPRLTFSGLSVEYFPKHAISKVSPSAMAFPNRAPGLEILYATIYDDADLDIKARDEIRRWAAVLNATAKSEKTRGYTNYNPEPSKAGAAETAFGVNYPKLREVKKKYDPENVFSKWFPIEPAA